MPRDPPCLLEAVTISQVQPKLLSRAPLATGVFSPVMSGERVWAGVESRKECVLWGVLIGSGLRAASAATREIIVRKSLNLIVPTLAAAGLLAACGSSSTSSSATTAASQPVAARTSSAAIVKTASNSTLHATVLVDAKGMTLYHLSGEHVGKFICASAACVKAWPPLAATGGKPSGTVGSLGTVKRPDGTDQVTYKGMPLYTFAADHAPGDAHGQGIKDVGIWSAVTTGASTASAAPAATTTSTSSSGAYGY